MFPVIPHDLEMLMKVLEAMFALANNQSGCYGCVAIYSIHDNLKHLAYTIYTSPKQPDHRCGSFDIRKCASSTAVKCGVMLPNY